MQSYVWARGRKEGAWVLALIAAAATSRKRYPKTSQKRHPKTSRKRKPTGDKWAFTSFIRDITHAIVTGCTAGPGPLNIRFYDENRGEHRKLEDIFYDELRCNLVHEGELKDVRFSESKLVDGRYEGTLSVPTRGPRR